MDKMQRDSGECRCIDKYIFGRVPPESRACPEPSRRAFRRVGPYTASPRDPHPPLGGLSVPVPRAGDKFVDGKHFFKCFGRAIFSVFIYLSSIHTVSYGQVSVRGIVADAESRKSLPHVSVTITNSNRGTVAYENGYFALTVKDQDSLLVTSVGYKKIRIATRDVRDTIWMKQEVVNLSEITVSPGKLKHRTRLGNVSGKSRIAIAGMHQIAYRIDHGPAHGELEVLYFFFQTTLNKEIRATTRVRLRIYENEDGRPGRDLLPHDIIVDLDGKQRELAYDIARYRIQIPDNGLFIGLDFLGKLNDQGKFIPYDKLYRPINLRLDCTDTSTPHTLQRSFGTDWFETTLHTRDGRVKPIDAKIGARIVY